HYTAGLRAKLGLITEEDGDLDLAKEFLDCLKGAQADFTGAFRSRVRAADTSELHGALSFGGTPLRAWQAKWMTRLERQQRSRADVVAAMSAANPAVIPRNHRVEEALAAAVAGDLSVMHRLLDAAAGNRHCKERMAEGPPSHVKLVVSQIPASHPPIRGFAWGHVKPGGSKDAGGGG
ncbi:MAG: protein adenylyltransferase SelO family protein, partial [bacterium]